MAAEPLTILNAEKTTGVPRKTLRYYEELGLLRPARSSNGYRKYDARTVDRIRFIVRAKHLGFRLKDIAAILELSDADTAPCEHVATLIGDKLTEIDERIGELNRLRADLQNIPVIDSGSPCTGEICHLIEDAPVHA